MSQKDDMTAAAVPPAYAGLALGLTVEDWSNLGVDDEDDEDVDLDDHALNESLKERMTALLLIRLVALLTNDKAAFPDMSSSTICRTVLVQEHDWAAYAPAITDDFLASLKNFVSIILDGYLIDLMLQTDPETTKTFGLRHDPLAQFAMLFAALVHDVEHKGVPNRQLVNENDPLAVLYNDESIAEQRSLFIAFDLFLSPDFTILRETILGGPIEDEGAATYRRFRKIVIDLVLNTDIASPVRTQVSKSKWKEAFGDTFESIERKLKHHLVESAGKDAESFYGDNLEEESFSETPESSEVEGENTNNNGAALTPTSNGQVDNSLGNAVMENFDDLISAASGVSFRSKGEMPPSNRSFRGGRRRDSTHSVPHSRRASVQSLQSDEVYKAKFQRRMSSYSGPQPTPARRASGFRKRLGIRRSMDLSGESLEVYRRSGNDKDMDEPDELKAQVVMETIITAADVAHNLQGWDQMVVWSGRLYLELRKAYVEGRGSDPQAKWFENQIGFLESYLLPLARRLEDANIFGDSIGMMFAQIVEQNRDKWLEEGQEITEAIIAKGSEIYNDQTLADERNMIQEQTRLTGKGNGLKFRGTNLAGLSSS